MVCWMNEWTLKIKWVLLSIFCCCLVTKFCLTVLRPHGLYSLPVSSVHGVSQARILEWVALSSSGGFSLHWGWIWVSRIASGFFTPEAPGEPPDDHKLLYNAETLLLPKNGCYHLGAVFPLPTYTEIYTQHFYQVTLTFCFLKALYVPKTYWNDC